MDSSRESGSATVEHAALGLLLALAAAITAAAVLADPPERESQLFAASVARRIACGPRAPGPCRRDRLVEAYGRPIARVVRALAPSHPYGNRNDLLPVDFRYCRRRSCAVPADGARGRLLSRSNRRATAFVEVVDMRRRGGGLEVVFWLYRPGEGWQTIRRHIDAGTARALASVARRPGGTPELVPLETLPGRNHYRFSSSERPGWQWRVRP